MTNADDNEIWEWAKVEDFCIVTQDADFAEKSRLYGSPPKVIWLRCGNATTAQIEAILRSAMEAIEELSSDFQFRLFRIILNDRLFLLHQKYFLILNS